MNYKFGFITFHVMTLMLVLLKLLNVLTCNWWWVISPTLFVIGFTLLIITMLVFKVINRELDMIIDEEEMNEERKYND